MKCQSSCHWALKMELSFISSSPCLCKVQLTWGCPENPKSFVFAVLLLHILLPSPPPFLAPSSPTGNEVCWEAEVSNSPQQVKYASHFSQTLGEFIFYFSRQQLNLSLWFPNDEVSRRIQKSVSSSMSVILKVIWKEAAEVKIIKPPLFYKQGNLQIQYPFLAPALI